MSGPDSGGDAGCGRSVIEPWRDDDAGGDVRDCEVCGGDCSSANPPIVYCPVKERKKRMEAVERAREMLKLGIDIQATGEVTNAVVTGVIRSLLDHIDEIDADLKCAIAVGRMVALEARLRVKPLKWCDHRPDSFPEPAWSAQTPFGFYNIEEVSASDSPAYVVRLHAHHFVADKESLDDAKDAAQADYEQRIRSALAKPDASNASARERLRDETGWLIEMEDPPIYHFVTEDHDEHWTPDANQALRFARREDAQAYSDHIGWTSPPVRIVEHMWPAGGDEAKKSTAAPRKFARCINGHRSTVPDDAFSTDTASTHACPVCGYGVIVDSPGDLPRGDYPLSRSIGTASSPAGGDEATKSAGGPSDEREQMVECPSCRNAMGRPSVCKLCGDAGEVTERQSLDFGSEP